MRQHQLWAVSHDGRCILVTVQADSAEAAAARLRSQGLQPLNGHAPQTSSQSARAVLKLGAARYDEILAQQLLTLTRSGVGAVESLRALTLHAEGAYARVLADIRSHLEAGQSLASALEQVQGFDPLFVALLRAAERTSNLESALERFMAHRQRANAIRQRLVTTAVYPLLLLAVGSAVLMLLLLHVVPRFSMLFRSMHTELPWAAALMLEWGDLVRRHGAWLFLGGAAAAALAAVSLLQRGLRQRALHAIVQLGWVGRQVRLGGLCRYYRTTASLLGGGIPLPEAMAMATRLLPLPMQAAGTLALQRIRDGGAPAETLQEHGLSTAIARQLIEAGQRTGQLGAMLDRAAEFHEAEVAQQVERFMKILEPAVMTAVGAAIGIVVILMYMPIFELASAVR